MFEVSVPGSVMLMGEHAVLHGYPAIVAAINRRIKAALIPRSDNNINIIAKNFGEIKLELKTIKYFIKQEKKFNYVLAAIQQFDARIPSGFSLHITSDFSDQLGLGSSAAVTVATLAVLQKWILGEINLDEACKLGVKTIRAAQNNLGSGADVAASVYGGVIFYQISPLRIEKLNITPEIALIYTGYKKPTVEVINKINRTAQESPAYFDNLYKIIEDLVLKGIKCFKQQDWQGLGQLFYAHFDAQRALGVSDAAIDKIIAELKNISTVYGAKISGAGLGDCVVALGRVDNIKTIDAKIDKDGVKCAAN